MKNSTLIKLNTENIDEAVEYTAKVLLAGGIAVIPTETVYGIAAPINNSQGIIDIFKAKGRPSDNPLIVHISNKNQIKKIVTYINPLSEKLIEAFFPGPLTIIFDAKKELDRRITAGLDTVAIRMPENKFTLKLIDKIGPIAAPSANISGKPSGTTIDDIIEELNGRVDIFIDDGNALHGIESTVINPLVQPPQILRKGSITKENIEKVIGNVSFPEKFSSTISPGTRYKHYAPSVETTYLKKIEHIDSFNIILSDLAKTRKLGIISFGTPIEIFNENIILKDLSPDPKIATKKLFNTLRELDRIVEEIIILPLPDYSDLWLSIDDRLERGANKVINSF